MPMQNPRHKRNLQRPQKSHCGLQIKCCSRPKRRRNHRKYQSNYTTISWSSDYVVPTDFLFFFFLPRTIRSAAAYYALTQHSKGEDVSSAEIDNLWGKVTEKQKTKYIQEHKKKQKEYVANFEKFVRVSNKLFQNKMFLIYRIFCSCWTKRNL